ncbi:filamentous hemagglutinin N-terminal domain-containing protein [Microcoleus sp. FACHB-53]|nr:filamentous hemagglutinin N-terminal domain-containing protein [Microcoleus sp. FACHB-53]
MELSNPLNAPQRLPLRPSALKKQDRRIAGAIALMGGCAIAFSGNRTLAQSNIVPDNTLGGESSFVVPNFNGLPVEAIAGGTARGQNLFHSFVEFNVSADRGAYFFSPNADIQNILARVTGNNPSRILGTIGTFGNSTPNLFLINPNGISFGEKASLDVGGSFVATTANAIRLGNTGLFSASEPQTSNLLAINPNAFFYNQLSNQGQIVNRSTATTTVLGTPTIGLQVPDGRSLLLVGGDVRLEGGRLFALGGRIELGGVAQNGTLELTTNGNELRLGFPTDVARSDVLLTNEAEVNVRAGGGGSIAINARNVEVLGGSKVRAGIASGLGSAESKAGDIEVNATGTTTIAGELSFLANVVQPEGVGKSGDINITTRSLFVKEGGYFNSSTQGQGDAGNVTINARDIVSFDGTDPNGGTSRAVSTVAEGAVGNGGNINITTGSLFVTNGAELVAGTAGQGNAGSVRITATDTVRFDGGYAASSVAERAVGDGGDVEITTNSLEVTNGTQLSAGTIGQGNAGSVRIIATDTVRFDGGYAFSSVEAGALGNGGDIQITTGSLSVTNGAQLIANTAGQGNAGSVRITATDTVSFDGVASNGLSSAAFSNARAGALGDGGDIEITTNSLSVTNGALLSASTAGKGKAGSVRISATDTVSFDGGDAFSLVRTGAVGNGGDIEITTGSLLVTNGAVLFASTFGQGKAGSVRITATDTVSFDGVASNGLSSSSAISSVGEGGAGDGGDIEINTGSLEVTNGAYLSAGTNGQGKAGSVRITASDTVSFDGVGSNGLPSSATSSVGAGVVGDGGDNEINTGSLSVSNGAYLSASNFGQGKAGSVRITATDTVRFDKGNADSFLGIGAVGVGGDIEINTGSLEVINGAQLSAGTFGQGNSGSVRISATDTVGFDGGGAFSNVGLGAVGNGGDIEITTGSIEVTNGASLFAATAGRGNAGSVKITATDTVRFDGVGSNGLPSEASSSVVSGGVGNGGDIVITTNSLEVTNGAGLAAQTAGQGNAGSIRITATDTVRFDGGIALSAVGEGAVGDGSDIEITTGSLEVTNGAGLNAFTAGKGNAGSVRITATDTVRFDGGNASSFVYAGAVGNGGNIEITTDSLEVTNGLSLLSSTLGQGNAGSLKITASDTVSFDRGTAYSSVEAGAEGKGGDIEITTGSLSLTDALISSESRGTGTAGDITLQTTQNLEMNRSSILATTQTGNGGNIRLRMGDLLVMRNDSNISTTAGVAGAGGDGGNININAGFAVAVPKEDSDITANAFNGRGGNINITTQGIYGLTFREQDIPASSDITASSQFGLDGEFQLDLLTNVDPSRGLAELPTNVVDASQQIDRRCTPAAADQKSSFVIIGRGGLPPSPNDLLQNDEGITPNWITLNAQAENISGVTPQTNLTPSTPKQLVEAQSWIYGAHGEVILTAQASSVTPDKSWQTSPSCHDIKPSSN